MGYRHAPNFLIFLSVTVTRLRTNSFALAAVFGCVHRP